VLRRICKFIGLVFRSRNQLNQCKQESPIRGKRHPICFGGRKFGTFSCPGSRISRRPDGVLNPNNFGCRQVRKEVYVSVIRNQDYSKKMVMCFVGGGKGLIGIVAG